MSPDSIDLSLVRRARVLTAAALLGSLAQGMGPARDDGYADAPALVLNEVLFDPEGAAGTEDCYQFVELRALKACSTSGVSVQRANGSMVFALPDIELPGGTHLVLFLGPSRPEIENLDPDAGAIVLTSGHAFTDVIGVENGDVVLVGQGGAELDRIAWGVVPAAGPFVDISHANGAPFLEGDSIGRSADSAYTGSSTDWTTAGGVNANGVTPGSANIVWLPRASDVVLYQDTLLNSVLVALSQSNEGSSWLQVSETAPSVVQRAPLGPDAVLTDVKHTLLVSVHGTPVSLTGIVSNTTTRSTTPGSVSETWHSSGIVASADGQWALSIDFEQAFTGAHAIEQTVNTTAGFSWVHAGVPYDAAMNGVWRQTRVDDHRYSGSDLRTGQDWSGLDSKSAYAAWISERLGDGVWRIDSSTWRTCPSLLAHPGVSHAGAPSAIETVSETTELLIGGRGVLGGTLLDFTQAVGGSIVACMPDGAVGTLEVQETQGPDGLAFAVTAHYPLVSASGAERDLVLETTGQVVELDAKQVTHACATAELNGVPVRSSTVAIDPPQGFELTPPWEHDPRVAQAIGVWVTCVQSSANKPPSQPKPTPMGGAPFVRQLPILGVIVNAYCLYKAVSTLL
jgi:hypothetical protein